ncbi:MAG: ATP-binding protein [Candidatus Omnitrophota bacterium]
MARETNRETNMPASCLRTDYHLNLVITSFKIRIFNILVVLAGAHVIRDVFGVAVPAAAMSAFYAWLLTCSVYLALFSAGFFRTDKAVASFHFSYYFFGVSYVTMLVHYLGGAEGITFFLYFLEIIYANVLMRRLKGALITVFVSICYCSLLMMQNKGIIPQQNIFFLNSVPQERSGSIFFINGVFIGTLFFLMAYSVGLFAKMKTDREKRLIESTSRYETKSRQLEKTTRILRKKIAENKYLKRAAMGYIEKKEYELELSRKDLEEQIDKLRKTQKSMVFMIEDLNSMSEQLKESRDHLEDKVRERTDELLSISGKLHRSERLAFLGKLSGSVTHELRNPLAVLKNTAYCIRKKIQGKTDEKGLKYIDIMEKEITRIDSIIDDIMGFARTQAPLLEETDVKDLMTSAVDAVDVPEMVEIKEEFRKVPVIKVDREQVKHAIMNIVNNAIIAMNGNGTLTIRAFKKDEYVCMEIEDTGPGIPPDQRALVFEPLFSSKPKGTGLGLPIAKMMVENQDGYMDFESRLGVGTVFKIFLPAGGETREKKIG